MIKKQYYKIDIKRKLLCRVCGFRKGRNLFKNLTILFFRIFPECLINNKKFMLKIDELCKENDFDACDTVANFYGNWGFREVMKKANFGS